MGVFSSDWTDIVFPLRKNDTNWIKLVYIFEISHRKLLINIYKHWDGAILLSACVINWICLMICFPWYFSFLLMKKRLIKLSSLFSLLFDCINDENNGVFSLNALSVGHRIRWLYFLQRGARGVMVIVVGNWHGDTSSNPGRDWLHFHIALIPLGKVWIQSFSLQLWVNSRTD